MLLNEDRIQALLSGLEGWTREGNSLKSEFRWGGFPAAIQFVNQVADLAEAANHHPDIDIRWNKVRLVLSTHSEGGLTQKDFDLAEQINRLRQ